MLPLLDQMNEQLKPLATTALKVNTSITLPKVQIVRSSGIRVFSKDSPEQRSRANDLLTNWGDIQARKIEPQRPSGSFAVRYDSYEFSIPTESDDTARALFQRLVPLRSRNILITPLVLKQGESNLNSGAFPSATKVEGYCKDGKLNGKSMRYSDLFARSQDALPHLKNLPPPEPVSVYLIDTVLHPLPVMQSAQNASPSAAPLPCSWAPEFINSLHHATHLYGLIASDAGRNLFEGVARNAAVQSFPWVKPDEANPSKAVKAQSDRDLQLRDLIAVNYEGQQNLPVYLAAVQFEPYLGLVEGQLPAEVRRYQGRPLESSIREVRPLLVAAAGQPEKKEEPASPLSPNSPRSPQNLGDFQNVVVVTACTECGAEQQALYERANFAVPGFPMVHVAAPGGDPIAGWVNDKEMGAGGGTSQAAALVAGVAAAMIGHYPRTYTEAWRVKKRLQMTSRPLAPQADGTAHPSAKHLTGGIVDPVLALLDPTKHWLREGGAWKPIKIRHWSSGVLVLKNTNGYENRPTATHIGRLVKTFVSSNIQVQPDLWTVMIDASKDHGAEPGAVDRHDLIQHLSGATIVLCDGTSKSWDKIDDVIFAASGIKPNECSSN
jgi:hypothetical protein